MFDKGHFSNYIWNLASVVSVLEPVYGFAAMKNSNQLLKGMTGMGFVLVFGYLAVCGVINVLFGSILVHGEDDYGVLAWIMVGGFLVGVLVIVNLIGLLVQSVLYYVGKSYHHQGIDKSALYDHLGGYLGEYVPLTSSIQIETWTSDDILDLVSLEHLLLDLLAFREQALRLVLDLSSTVITLLVPRKMIPQMCNFLYVMPNGDHLSIVEVLEDVGPIIFLSTHTRKPRNESFLTPFHPRYPDILANSAHPMRAQDLANFTSHR